jgi:lipopolysaccharide export LptBFGC system permease protein LptF
MDLNGLFELGAAVVEGVSDSRTGFLLPRRVRRPILLTLWLISVAAGLWLWFIFVSLFDRSPGWAVLLGGSWALLVFATIATTIAALRAYVGRPPS